MQTQLYPAEFAEDSLERLYADRSRHSHVIYLLVVLTLLASLAVLPVATVDVSIQSAGIIRPTTEKHEVKARVSGMVEQLLVRENDQVRAGQPLLVLRRGAVDEQGRMLTAQLDERRRSLHDLELVGTSAMAGAEPAAFRTSRYRQAWAQFRTDLREVTLREDRAVREAERARALGGRRMLSASEVEDKEFQLAQARGAASQLREKYLTGWQGELSQARSELRALLAQQGRLVEETDLYRIGSPVTGTVEQMRGVSTGSFIMAGDAIAVISPSAALQAEISVSPRDIGALHAGMPVRFQVDAFTYTDWGMATGRVREISDDFVTVDGRPAFKVKCSLDQEYLTLKGGFRGHLKKGMTLRARFVVARRSLWQLLYESANDWLDPAQANPASAPR